jgi:hypothetical protein
MIRNLARVLAVVLVGIGALVACGDDQQACAATMGNPRPNPPKYNPPPRPSGQRTSSKVQDRTSKKTTTGTSNGSSKKSTNPYWRSSSKPTTWGGYNTSSRNWSQPYRKNMPVAPQPVIVNYYGHDYRTYPMFPGYYPVGVWPVGYGAHYGCVAEREAEPEQAPTPAPTVTVTVPPSPTETPR